MNIIFTKNNPATHTITIFKDGEKWDEVTLDTKTYFLHDLTHYCVELELNLKGGFWGMIAQGHKMAQLSGKTNELTDELRRIEHIVGATQSVYLGYMPIEMFYENLKLVSYSVPAGFIENMSQQIQAVMNDWNYLPVGDSIKFDFAI
ncbi:MAG: hypothetical protein V4580_18295 [Bacteroidota bacterium]